MQYPMIAATVTCHARNSGLVDTICGDRRSGGLRRAGMPFTIFPHMLRHACGYALANAGHDTRALQAWLGHKNIQHTVRYTELAPDRFKNFWRD
jgi:site-specific recombinase XerD